MEISYPSLAKDLMKAIRHEKTFVEIERISGLGKNQYSRWEKGLVLIKWDDFVKVAKASQIPIKVALEKTLGYKGNPFRYDLIITACCGRSPQNLIGNHLKVSRFVVGKWLKGKTCPSLAQMLQIIQLGTTRLSVFIEAFSGNQNLPSFAAYLGLTQKTLQLLEHRPWASGVLSLLDRSDYHEMSRHDDAWIAARLGISQQMVRETLRVLQEFGLIEKKQDHFHSTLKEIDPSVLKLKAKDLLLYWVDRNERAIQKNYPSSERKSLSSYQIFSVNRKTAQDIKDLYIEFVKQTAVLIHNGQKNSTETYSFIMSMINFDEL
jgi:DNA-binding HxlR family transcriptional regulator